MENKILRDGELKMDLKNLFSLLQILGTSSLRK
jgi:hypothetical protein